MTSRIQISRISRLLSILAIVLVLSSIFILPAYAKNTTSGSTSLNNFIESVKDGNSSALRGVYVQDVMTLPIIQQPVESPGFVSQNNGQLTQFNIAAQAGNIGLLAHNYLSGNSFSQLKNDDVVVLIYGDGHTESFSVTSVLQYQALDPYNTNSEFKDLQTQATLSAEQLFDQVYRGEKHVTFQTCIEKDGNLSWGRLFIIAEPITNNMIAQTDTSTGGLFDWLWRDY